MADVTLSDGRELTLDLYQITISEFRSLFKHEQAPEEENRLLAKVSGLTVEEFEQLPYPDWKLLTTAFFVKAKDPLKEKN